MTERGILTTDAYQLTMAQLYFSMGMHEREVRFEHFFRSNPDYGEHQAGYCIAAGLGPFSHAFFRSAPGRCETRHRSGCGQPRADTTGGDRAR